MRVVKFTRSYLMYNKGETAGFADDQALALVAAGVCFLADAKAEADAAAKAEADALAAAEKAAAEQAAAEQAAADAAKAAAEQAAVEAAAKTKKG